MREGMRRTIADPLARLLGHGADDNRSSIMRRRVDWLSAWRQARGEKGVGGGGGSAGLGGAVVRWNNNWR